MNRQSGRKRILVGLAGALSIAAFLTLVLTLSLLSQGGVKWAAQYAARAFFDRELVIDGPLELHYSMQPRITAANLSLSNADWGSAPELLTVSNLSVRLDLSALFTSRLHILDLRLNGAVLNIEDPVDGEPNWLLTSDDEEEEDDSWSFLLEGFQADNSVINAMIGELAPVRLEIPHLGAITDPDGNLVVEGSGDLNSEGWRLTGSIGTLEQLLSAGFLNLDMELTLGDTKLSATGSIGELATLSGTDLALSLSGSDAIFLGELLGIPEDFAGDIALSARIQPQGGSHAFEMRGHVARFQVDATGKVDDLAELDGWSAHVNASGPDAVVFGKLMQISDFPGGEYFIAGDFRVNGSELRLSGVSVETADVRLEVDVGFGDFPDTGDASGDWLLAGPDLSRFAAMTGLEQLPAHPFQLVGSLNGSQDSLTAQLKIGSHQLSVRGEISGTAGLSGTQLTVDASGAEIDEVLQLLEIGGGLRGAYSASGSVSIDNAELSLSDLKMINGPFELKGGGNWPSINQADTLSGRITLTTANLAAAGRVLDIPDLPEAPMTVDAEITAKNGAFELTDSKLAVLSLTGRARGRLGRAAQPEDIDITINLQGENLDELFPTATNATARPTPFETSARLGWGPGGLKFSEFVFKSPDGKASAEGHLSFAEDFVGTELKLSVSGKDLASLLPDFPGYQPPSAPFQAEAGISIPNAESLKLTDSQIKLGSVSLLVDGVVNSSTFQSGSIDLQFSGQSLADLGHFESFTLPDIELELATQLRGGVDAIDIHSLQAFWGDSDLSAAGSITFDDIPTVVLSGRSRDLHLSDLADTLTVESDAEHAPGENQRLIPDQSILLDELTLANVSLDMEVGSLRGQLTSFEDVDVKLKLQDGELDLQRMAYRDSTGRFDLSGWLKPRAGAADVQLRINADDLDLGLFLEPDQQPRTIPRYDIDVEVSGSGRTVVEVVGSLNGNILVSSLAGGQISNPALERFGGDFLSQLYEAIGSTDGDNTRTSMDCLVLSSNIKDGIAELDPGLVIRTDRVELFVLGSIDLADERLDLVFKTEARRGLGVSLATIAHPFLKVGGTFSSPEILLDTTSAAVTYGLATATWGWSIILDGILGRLDDDTNPCITHQMGGRSANRER